MVPRLLPQCRGLLRGTPLRPPSPYDFPCSRGHYSHLSKAPLHLYPERSDNPMVQPVEMSPDTKYFAKSAQKSSPSYIPSKARGQEITVKV